jgi:sugar O-acyltransferase (sialic acid O-acetyltransferase NeuD family)
MDVVIIGAGGHGKVVLDIIQAAGKHRVVGFLDADPALAGSQINGVPVLGQMNQVVRLKQQKIRGAIVAIGDNRVRVSYAALLAEHSVDLITAIHPAAVVANSARIGHNAVVAAGAVLAASAAVAHSAILNTGCIVDHECELEAGVHICPGALLAGRVRVGAGAFIGLGAKILPCLSIGKGSIVGAGAVVLKDVPEGVTVVGVPARMLEKAAGHVVVS